MLISSVLAGLLVGWLRGGSLWNLAAMEIRYWWLVILAFAVNFILYTRTQAPAGGFLMLYGPYLHILVYIPLLVVVGANRSLAGMPVVGAGVVANALVIVANGGQMPVSMESLLKAGLRETAELLEAGGLVTHALIGNETRLVFLGDTMVVPWIFGHAQVVSPGDLLLVVGITWLVQAAMLPGDDNREGR